MTWKKCECRLNVIIWNKNKSRYEFKELIDKWICNKGFIWNPSNCECKRDKKCDFSEYLDYENFKCRKQLVDELINECTETIEEVKLVNITIFEIENNYKYNSCIVYIVLMIVFFTIFTGITVYLVYYNWSLIKNNVSWIKFNTHKETEIWEIHYTKWKP